MKANGHVSCDDSNGYEIILGEVSQKPRWDVRRILDGPVYRHIRESFARGQVPWPGTCEGCDLFSSGKPPDDTLLRRITLRIEPTLACELKCPSCKRGREVRTRSGDWDLAPAKLENLVRSCAENAVDVGAVEYLGWGEPLDHPHARDLVSIVKRHAPDAFQELTTNANHAFSDVLGNTPLDRLICSVDGVEQSSYEKYRRLGSSKQALDFIRDAKRDGASGMEVWWKFVVFDFNDTDEELIHAQELAAEFGIDRIQFIITNSKMRSRRFFSTNLPEFPLVAPMAEVVPAAAYQKVVRAGMTHGTTALPIRTSTVSGYFDRWYQIDAGLMVVEGWCLDENFGEIQEIEVLNERNEWTRVAETSIPRPDVAAEKLLERKTRCGFVIRTRTLPEAEHQGITLKFRTGNRESVVYQEFEFVP